MTQAYSPNTKPYTRWWWFANEIKETDIRDQLDWLAENGFGGVEIAWVYPLPDQKPATPWLSEEWSSLVAVAKEHATRLGLGCDFTFGTLWPFGGSMVKEGDATQVYDGLSEQRLNKCWEGDGYYVLNHLDQQALERYAATMGGALAPALEGPPSALFCDSWEVRTEGLWTEGFGKTFEKRFGYDIRPFMEKLDDHPQERYDYRKLISDYVIDEFYAPFTRIAHELGAFTRVQCHGAPTDLVAAYAAVDVPESESILFDPHFSSFATSAAAVRGHGLVSAETFTCLYGWLPYPGPGQHQGREQVADMKLLADALFANGVNWIYWHGMPFNPMGGANQFYASVHVGPDSGFAAHIPAFNGYMEKVSKLMRTGRIYSDVAVYLPLEDNWMKNRIPEELKRPSAFFHWELQYQRLPDALAGYHPLWITDRLLADARVADGRLHCDEADFSCLYVDVEWLDKQALERISSLASQGLPVCVKRPPKEPGRNKSELYESTLAHLMSLDHVSVDFKNVHPAPPLVEGEDMPEFQCRIDTDSALIFFAHPKTKTLRFPMQYGQSATAEPMTWKGAIHLFGKTEEVTLNFAPYQSLALKLDRKGGIKPETIDYVPPAPPSPPVESK